MRFVSLFLLALSLNVSGTYAQSVFIPENGKYEFSLQSITESMKNAHVTYVELKHYNNALYKHDRKRNEFQIKDWFLQDWYLLQDMWNFDLAGYIRLQKAATFNEAKRAQYKKFQFDKKGFYHHKAVPTMKEWGGLTHPPIKRLTLPLEKYDQDFAPLIYANVKSPFFDPTLQLEIDHVSKSELTFGNKVIPLPDRFAFEKKIELIKKARESILMSSLVFVCDSSTRRLVGQLIRKHREGVDVKILVDGFIGKVLGHRECLKVMRDAGIEVIESKDFFRHKLKAIYHTKTLVTDLNEAVAGGHNLIDADNTSRNTDFKNRDVDLYVSGPMVSDIAKQFLENWHYQGTLRKNVSSLSRYAVAIRKKITEERTLGLRGKNFYARILGNTETRMKGVCRFIKQAPYEDRHTIGKAYLLLLNHVEKNLTIEDPVKTDTYIARMSDAPLSERFDNFEMFNRLHLKVQELARKGKKINYITTNINMAGNENVAIMNERIKGQLEQGKNMWANWSLAKLHASNSYYGRPHYNNLMKDWMPFPNVHIWKHISFMHSKVFYFDRIVASVGSYNFQHNATDQAYESTAICMDESLNRNLDRILVEDMANSVPLIFSSLR